VKTGEGLSEFNECMRSRSYVRGWEFSPADAKVFLKLSGSSGVPEPGRYPHAHRWYVHIAAILALKNGRIATARSPACAVAPTVRQTRRYPRERILVGIEIVPRRDVERNDDESLVALCKRVERATTHGGLKWGESCTLVPDGVGATKKIRCTFVIATVRGRIDNNSANDVVNNIQTKFRDDVQSCEVISSTNVL